MLFGYLCSGAVSGVQRQSHAKWWIQTSFNFPNGTLIVTAELLSSKAWLLNLTHCFPTDERVLIIGWLCWCFLPMQEYYWNLVLYVMYCLEANSVESNPFWKATCSSATQCANTLWDPRFHYCVLSLPQVPNVSQMIPVHIDSSYYHISRRSIWILSCHLYLGLHSGLPPSGLPTSMWYSFPISQPYMLPTCLARLMLLNWSF